METYTRGGSDYDMISRHGLFKGGLPAMSEFHPLSTPLRVDLPSYQNT